MKLFLALAAFLFPLAAPAMAQVALSWADNSNNETGFRIERAIGVAGAFAPWDEVAANVRTYSDTAVAPATTYRYRIVAFNAAGSSPPSNILTVTTPGAGIIPAAASALVAEVPGTLVNVSTRGTIGAGDATLIPGFVVAGGQVRALIRVVGPTLGAPPFGVPGVCADPRLELRDSAGAILATNDNWHDSTTPDADLIAAAAAAGAFALPADSRDAAVLITLPPGTYTVIARGAAGATGIVLAEVYKLP